MAESINDKIKRSLQATADLYCRLVLLVGGAGAGKTAILQEVAAKLGAPVINVNLELSRELLGLAAKRRPLELPRLLAQIAGRAETLLILDNLEILFDHNLQQDPLRLLQRLARNRAVVASWNGCLKSQRLFYAENGHPEYRDYDPDDALIVNMDGTATIDAAVQR